MNISFAGRLDPGVNERNNGPEKKVRLVKLFSPLVAVSWETLFLTRLEF